MVTHQIPSIFKANSFKANVFNWLRLKKLTKKQDLDHPYSSSDFMGKNDVEGQNGKVTALNKGGGGYKDFIDKDDVEGQYSCHSPLLALVGHEYFMDKNNVEGEMVNSKPLIRAVAVINILWTKMMLKGEMVVSALKIGRAHV